MSLKIRKALAACVAIAAMAVIAPAAASANTAWVNNGAPVKSPFNSCANPGFSSIQAAINSPSTGIRVCKGTYEEQLQIERALTVTGEPGVTVKLPASPVDSTTPCAVPGEQDVIGVCGKGVETVKLSSIVIEGYWPAGTCKEHLYGIFVGGKANLSFSKSSIQGAGANPINGCQGGTGIRVGKNSTGQVGTAALADLTIEGHQKNGITIDGAGSKATIKKVTVKGAGPAPIGQNGIQISRGAVGKITESNISGSECSAGSCGNSNSSQLEEDGAGVLFYKEAPGSSVATSTINENDLGVSHISATETNKPQVTIVSNTLVKDRYAAVMVGQGFAAVNKNTMEEGSVGILVLQYAGQEFGPRGTGSEDTIAKMSKYAIEGLSDVSPSDQFGSFTIGKSKMSGNPGATPATSVFTNNPEKLKIFLAAGNS